MFRKVHAAPTELCNLFVLFFYKHVTPTALFLSVSPVGAKCL